MNSDEIQYRQNNSIYTENIHRLDNSVSKSTKVFILTILIVVTFVIYVLRLFTLQVVEGQQHRTHSEVISKDITTITSQRGEIFDRNAKYPMVINTDSFAVDVKPREIPPERYDTVITKLCEYLGMSRKDMDVMIPMDKRKSSTSIEVRTNIPFETICNIAENINDLPGISWRNKPQRNYVETGSISHVLGYVGNITSEELKIWYNKGYSRNYTVGKIGIERQYDELLQGKDGRISRVVDVHGRFLDSEPIVEPPKSGMNLVLTIDNSIQKLAEKTLGERVGAIVVLKPASGEILAMVSYPYFDANILSSTEQFSAQYSKYYNDKSKPMLNRVVNAEYPPASTFKTIMTTAILSEKVFPRDKKVECEGKIEYGNRIFNCHQLYGHGWLDLKNALAQSCDVYFWVLGTEHLGADRIANYAKEFGLGESLDIDLPAQSKGFVPTPQWKERRYHEIWLGGDTMNMSIGQGFTLVTPLHVANMMAMVCNSGKIYKPHLLKEVRDPSKDNEVVDTIQREVLHTSTVSQDVWREVQRDLRYTISDGTAIIPMANKTVKIAGKTGTAEVNGYGKNHWHSWMACYAPYDAPPEDQVVVVTLVEAVNKWEWWAPYATNIVIQGIFNDQTFEESVSALKFGYLFDKSNVAGGRRE